MHGFLLGILLSMRLNTPRCVFRLYLLIHVWLDAMPLISIRKLLVPIGCEVRVVSGELASTLLKISYYNCCLYTRVNKNPSACNFLSPKPEMTCGTVAIIIRVVLLSPYLRIRAVSLSSIHYNQ